MYIYNVTLNVEKTVHDEWLNWIEHHIKEMLDTGRFKSAKLTEVLVEEAFGAKTYSVQYTTESKKNLENYYAFDADKMRQEGIKKFGDKVLAFRTELKIVKEFYPTSVSN